MGKHSIRILMLILLCFFPLFLQAQEPIQLYEGSLDRPYQVLGPVSAEAKEIEPARQELKRQALKMQADAVVRVHCRPPGIEREGLNFAKVRAYCRGLGIKFQP